MAILEPKAEIVYKSKEKLERTLLDHTEMAFTFLKKKTEILSAVAKTRSFTLVQFLMPNKTK
jgi:hypothetical protein